MYLGPQKHATIIFFNNFVKHWPISVIFGMRH